ncbi:hypothetical protein AB0395_21770 [Streptosporangium sp. NPDC051023]|uniref:hypothetical protein n=1 Tax=Streptosporangium sp. NPDC051023 TaxID=3155410 RepID=UPI00344CD714
MAGSERRILPVTPQPSRHVGSRVVATAPDAVRTITGIRAEVSRQATRVRRESLTFAPADPSRGEPCTAAVMVSVLVAMIYRSGHNLYADVAMGTGAASVMQAQLAVPGLGLTGDVVDTAAGGSERDIRLRLELTDAWPMGEAHRVYVQARRLSGADATTVRLLGAWQR